MNYEQKYKEALEKLRAFHRDYKNISHLVDVKEELESIFPELKESEDEKIRKELIERFNWELKGAEEQDSAGCSRQKDIAMFKRGLAWLEKQGEQPSWSENDEKMINLLIKIFEVNHPNEHFKVNPIGTTSMEAVSTKEIADWLKSLKPNHWKPSEEQMEAIKYFIDFHRPQANASTEGWKEFKHLESLYNGLLKL